MQNVILQLLNVKQNQINQLQRTAILNNSSRILKSTSKRIRFI